MDVTITARHASISDVIREHALQRMSRLDRFRVRATSATLGFDEDAGQKVVEARVFVAGGPPLVARSLGPTFRDALDQTLDRLERQLKRQRDRRRRRRALQARVLRSA